MYCLALFSPDLPKFSPSPLHSRSDLTWTDQSSWPKCKERTSDVIPTWPEKVGPKSTRPVCLPSYTKGANGKGPDSRRCRPGADTSQKGWRRTKKEVCRIPSQNDYSLNQTLKHIKKWTTLQGQNQIVTGSGRNSILNDKFMQTVITTNKWFQSSLSTPLVPKDNSLLFYVAIIHWVFGGFVIRFIFFIIYFSMYTILR